MARMKTLIYLLGITLILGGCASQYKAPPENAPHANLKLKFEWVGLNEVGKEISAVGKITQKGATSYLVYDNGIEEMKVGDGRQIPFKNPTIRIEPLADTEVQVQMTLTKRTGTVEYRGDETHFGDQANTFTCVGRFKFSPQAGKSYLMDYKTKNVSEDCAVNLYEQAKGGALKEVGKKIDPVN